MPTILDTAAQRIGAKYQAKTGAVAPLSIITAILSMIATIFSGCPAPTPTPAPPAPAPVPPAQTFGDNIQSQLKSNSLGARFQATYAAMTVMGPRNYRRDQGEAIVESVLEVGAESTPDELNQFKAAIPDYQA